MHIKIFLCCLALTSIGFAMLPFGATASNQFEMRYGLKYKKNTWTQKIDTTTYIEISENAELQALEPCSWNSRGFFEIMPTDDLACCAHRQNIGVGKSAVIKINDVTVYEKSNQQPDSVVLSIALKDGVRNGSHSTALKDAQIIYSACTWNQFQTTPCYVGNEAEGTVIVNRTTSGDIILNIELSISAKDLRFPSVVGEATAPKKTVKINRFLVVKKVNEVAVP